MGYKFHVGAQIFQEGYNILDTRDISFWCTNFSGGVQILGYKFHVGAQICGRGYFIQGGGINFLKGYKFAKGVQIS